MDWFLYDNGVRHEWVKQKLCQSLAVTSAQEYLTKVTGKGIVKLIKL